MEKHKFNMDYKKWLDKAVKIHKIAANMSDVDDNVVLCGFRNQDIRIHVFRGIELLAEAVGEKITVSNHSDLYLEHGFEYEGCRVYQLEEKR